MLSFLSLPFNVYADAKSRDYSKGCPLEKSVPVSGLLMQDLSEVLGPKTGTHFFPLELGLEYSLKSEKDFFTLEVKDKLISLQAERASFKAILKDLEEKTGIKTKISEEVEDKEISLNISNLPVYAIHTLLEKMEIENFAVIYDQRS